MGNLLLVMKNKILSKGKKMLLLMSFELVVMVICLYMSLLADLPDKKKSECECRIFSHIEYKNVY